MKLRFRVPLATLVASLALPFAALAAPAQELAHCVEMPTSGKAASDAGIVGSHDHGNITVMELQGEYSRGLSEPRKLVARRYLESHPDRYDFLVVFTTFEFATDGALAFYNPVRNDTTGIGQPGFDFSDEFGSEGRLQGYVDMAATSRYALATRAPDFEQTRNTLAHELMHRWGAGVSYRTGAGSDSDALIGSDGAHWSFFLDSDASLMYGNDWSPRSDGRFESTSVRYRYSPLDLYLAGFAAAAEVPPMNLIQGGNGNPADLPRLGAISGGSLEAVRIEQIVAAEGARVPAASAAQKDFRAAFILLTRPGESVPLQTVAALEALRVRAQQHFAQVTDGRGILRIFNETRDNAVPQLPQILGGLDGGGGNGGLAAAVAWIKQRQQPDGHWQDRPATAVRDTSAVLQLLQTVEPGYAGIAGARHWLAAQLPQSNDAQAWKLVIDGSAATANALVQAQSGNGGWGLVAGLQDSPLDTAAVSSALARQGSAAASVQQALQLLGTRQNSDGSFGAVNNGRGRMLPTLRAAQAFAAIPGSTNTAIRDSATTWLLSRENVDGGLWGDKTASLADTIELFGLVGELPVDIATTLRLRQGVRSRQNTGGDWQGSVYLTATAALAELREQRVNLFVAGTPTALPANPVDGDLVRLEAIVANSGSTTAAASVARWYLGDPDQGGVQIGGDIALGPLLAGQRETLRHQWPSRDRAGANTLWLQLDATGALDEVSEADNRAALALSVAPPSAQADIVVDASLLALDPARIDSLPQTVTLSGVVRNLGSVAAANVLLRLSSESDPQRVLAEASVAIAARGETAASLSFETRIAQTQRLLLHADADNRIAEAREDNNQARFTLPFGATLDLALDADALSLTGAAPTIGRDVEFLLRVRNRGTQDGNQIPLLAQVVQGASTSTISLPGDSISVPAGETRERRLRWRALSSGAAQLQVRIDPANQFGESDESNNAADLDFNVGADTQPDLAIAAGSLQFTPEPGLQGQPLRAALRVRNNTNQAAGSFRVALYTADPSQGGQQLAAASVAGLAGESEIPLQIDLASLPLRADTTLQLVVDAAEQVEESDEGNNVALHTLSVLPLADIAVAASSITLTPSQPAVGAPLQARVRLRNIGAQAAAAFAVNLYEGSAESGSAVAPVQTVNGLAAGAEIELVWNWTFAQAGTPQQLTLVADALNTVAENEKRNNTAIVPLDVQQRGFYASERYFSPDGDGVRDETVLYFARPGAGNLRVDIFNGAGRLQRRYDALDPASQGGGQIAWDGRDERGQLVPDGDYRIVLRRDNDEIAQLFATVDLNRSNFIGALATRHEIQRELLPDADWRFAPPTPSTRGYAYAVTAPEPVMFAPEGIYRSNMLTGDREPVVSVEWLEEFLDGENGRLLPDFAFSPDGRLLVFQILRDDQVALAVAASDLPDRIRVLDPALFAFGPELRLLPMTFVDARTVVVGNLQQRWNIHVETGAKAAERALPPETTRVAVYGHGTYAYTPAAPSGERVSHYLSRNPQIPVAELPPPPAQATASAEVFSADGSALLRQYLDGNREAVQLYDAPARQLRTLYEANRRTYLFPGVTFPADASRIVAATHARWIGTADEILLIDGDTREARVYTRQGQQRLQVALPPRDEAHMPRPLWTYLGGPYTVGTVPGHAYRASDTVRPFGNDPYDPARRRATVTLSTDHYGIITCEIYVCFQYSQALDELFALDIDSGEVELLDRYTRNDAQRIGELTQFFLADGSLMRFDARYKASGQPLSEQPWRDNLYFGRNWSPQYEPIYSSDDSASVYEPEWKRRRLTATLANQTTVLWARTNERSIELSGAAADRNFDHYRLDYALQSAPGQWHSLTPPSSYEVLADDFMDWVPPEPGNYLIRLTTQDKAGNSATAYASAYSAVGSPVENVTPPARFLSPNGDDIKDTVSIAFRVRHASSFPIQVFAADGSLVRSDERVYTAADVGPHSYTWDGRNQAGQVVAEGRYRIGLAGMRFAVTLDTQLPQLAAELQQPLMMFTALGGKRDRGVTLLGRATARDANLEGFHLQLSEHGSNQWIDQPGATAERLALIGKDVRAVATDLAGNRTMLAAGSVVDQLIASTCIPDCDWTAGIGGSSATVREWQHPLPADFRPDGETQVIRGLAPRFTIRLDAQDVTGIELQIATSAYGQPPYSEWQSLASVPLSAALHIDSEQREATFEFPQLAELSVGTTYKVRMVGLRGDGSRTHANQLSITVITTPNLFVFCPRARMPENPALRELIEQAYPAPGSVLLVAARLRADIAAHLKIKPASADEYRLDHAIASNQAGDAFLVPSGASDKATGIYTLPNGQTKATDPVALGCSGTFVSQIIQPLVDPVCDSAPTNAMSILTYGPQPQSLHIEAINGADTSVLLHEAPPANQGSFREAPWHREIQWNHATRPERSSATISTELDYGDTTRGGYQYVPIVHTPVEFAIEFPAEGQRVCAPNPDGEPTLDVLGKAVSFAGLRTTAWLQNAGDARSRICVDGRGNELDCDFSPPTTVSPQDVGNDPANINGALYNFNAPRVLGLAKINGPAELHTAMTNWSGATVCSVRHFHFDAALQMELDRAVRPIGREMLRETSRHPLITDPLWPHLGLSLNGSALYRTARLKYTAAEPVDYTVYLHRVNDDQYGHYLGEPLQTLEHHSAVQGDFEIEWDGRILGSNAADGNYALRLHANDDCGWTEDFLALIVVDSTAPQAAFDTPAANSQHTAPVIDASGSVDDLHLGVFGTSLGRWELRLLRSPADNGLLLNSDDASVEPATPLGHWNRAGAVGSYSFLLAASDDFGNTRETRVEFNIPQASLLLGGIDARPGLFSPNNDTRLDQTRIELLMLNNAVVDIVVRAGTATGPEVASVVQDRQVGAGLAGFGWNGRGPGNSVIADGTYYAVAVARDPAHPNVEETAAVPLTIDTTPPPIGDVSPAAAFANAQDVVAFRVDEPRLDSYAAKLVERSSGAVVAQLTDSSRSRQILARVADLAEGDYRLEITAQDLAGNRRELVHEFTLDKTPPALALLAPADAAVIARSATPLDLRGSVSDAHLASYAVEIAAGSSDSWSLLASGEQPIDAASLGSWLVQQADGDYRLRLRGEDRAGNSASVIHRVAVDGTPPVASITQPADGAVLRQQLQLQGSAKDAHLQEYTVAIATTAAAAANQWTTLYRSETSVDDAELADLHLGQPDGDYVLRLRAVDAAGLEATARITLRLDRQPPPAPLQLRVRLQGSDAVLDWNAVAATDLAGYAVYRNGSRIDAALAPANHQVDAALADGRWRYQVSAVDRAGNESALSNVAELNLDRTPPQAQIHAPAANERVRGRVGIVATAYSADDFAGYVLTAQNADNSGTPVTLAQSSLAQQQRPVADWDTAGLAEESAIRLRLVARDRSGNEAVAEQIVVVDNAAPAAPQGLTALLQNTRDAAVSWNPNSEADLLGYLLYRDGRLVNGPAQLPADLRVFALAQTSFADNGLGDGLHNYVVFAIDRAGNLSQPSAPASAGPIESGPPHLRIDAPTAETAFEQSVEVRASSSDLDIARVVFAYRVLGDSEWSVFATLTSAPYRARWTPGNLPYGAYEIRALATDTGNLDDPEPPQVRVRYADLTAPQPPANLQALADGGQVQLNWEASSSSDIAGYRVERLGADWEAVGADTINLNSVDNDRDDALWTYRVRAVDTAGNLSTPVTAQANVFSLALQQPFTPLATASARLQGRSPTPGSMAVHIEHGAGSSDIGAGATDADGIIDIAALPLLDGDNHLFVRVTDASGHRSRASDLWLSRGSAPAVPVGLAAAANAHEVSLVWNLNSEADVIGYRVEHNGQVAPDLDLANLAASSDYCCTPEAAVDGNAASSWQIDAWLDEPALESSYDPALDIGLPQAAVVTAVQLDWRDLATATGNVDVYARSNRGAWIRLASQRSAAALSAGFNLDQPYRTDALRLVLRSPSARAQNARLALAELRVRAWDLVAAPPLQRTESDGSHAYRVGAVNALGFASAWSTAASVAVGDATPPDPVVLSVSLDGNSATATWTASASPDVANYRLRRDGDTVATVPAADERRHVDANLSLGTHAYEVLAIDGFGNASTPSNRIEVTVQGVGPGIPQNLSVSALAAGHSLAVSWNAGAGSTPVAWLLRRAASADGPFVDIAQIATTTHVDTGLVNGTRYHYTVSAIDAAGNRSAASAPASGVPYDGIAPAAPLLTYPTDAAHRLHSGSDRLPFCGRAEAGSTIALQRDGELFASATAAADFSTANYPGGAFIDGFRAAPDGLHIAFARNDGSSAVVDLRNQSELAVPGGAQQLQWAAHGETLYFARDNRVEFLRLGHPAEATAVDADELRRFAVSADESQVLLTGRYAAGNAAAEDGLWWLARDGSTARKITGILLEDLAEADLQLSHDARFALAADYALHWQLIDLALGTRIAAIEGNTDVAPSWAPDGRHFAFSRIGTEFGSSTLWIYDTATQQARQLAELPQSIAFIGWSPDGSEIAIGANAYFYLFDAASGVARADAPAAFNSLHHASVRWTASGRLLLLSGIGIEALTPPGWFCSSAAALRPGLNRIAATATDAAGNRSLSSLPVEIELAGVALPDLALRSSDVFFTPATAQPGQPVSALFTLRNLGQTSVAAPEISVTLVAPDGSQRSLALAEPVAALGAGAARSIALELGVLNQVGQYRLRLYADPRNALNERDENNNQAEALLDVIADAQPQLDISTSRALYAPGESVSGEIRVSNPGSSFSGRLRAQIVDADGNLVVDLGESAIAELGYAQRTVRPLNWNAAGVFAGNYQLRAQLLSGSGIALAERSAGFAIDSVRHIQLAIAAQPASIAAGATASIASSLQFRDGNALLSGASLRAAVVDANGVEVWTRTHGLGVLAPGYELRKEDLWTSSPGASGVYTLRLQLLASSFAATAESSLLVSSGSSGPQLHGSLALAPSAQLIAGQPGQLGYRVNNAGNAVNALELRLRVFQALDQPALFERSETLSLAAGAEYSTSVAVDAPPLDLRSHVAVLDARLPGDAAGEYRLLARQGFQAIDAQPPQIAPRAPQPGSWQPALLQVQADILDAHSSVAAAELRIDNGSWQPVSRGSDGRFARSVDGLAEGTHSLLLRARDSWGNESSSAPIAFQVDATAPQIQIDGIAEGALTNAVVQVAVQIADAHLDATQTRISLDGQDYLPGTPIASDGEHVIAVRAQDLAGNLAQATRRFRIDRTPPTLQVLQPADGSVVADSSIDVVTHSEAAARVRLSVGSHSAELDADAGGNASFAAVPLVEGDNRIELQATDRAGNASATLAVVVRYQPAVALPLVGTLQSAQAELPHGQDLQVALQLRNPGTQALEAQSLRLGVYAAGGSLLAQRDYSRPFAAGEEFSDAPSFATASWPLGLLSLRLDILRNGNWVLLDELSLTLVDRTPPLLQALAPLDGSVQASPLRLRASASDALSPPPTLEYRLDDGAWLPLQEIAGQPGQFHSEVLKLGDGDYRYVLRARDGAGNLAESASAMFALDNTPPAIVIDGVADADLLNHAVTPTLGIVDAHPASSDFRLNGQPFASGSSIAASGSYTLQASARDAAGNEATRQIQFTLDLDAPQIVVTAPLHGSTVTIAAQEIAGTTEADADVHIDAPGLQTSVRADAAGNFRSIAATLQPGLNTLRLRATDRAGNTGPERVVEVTYQPTVAQTASAQFLNQPRARRGQPLVAQYLLRNSGSVAMDAVAVRAELRAASGGDVLASDDWNASLAPQQETEHSASFATGTLAAGAYRIAVSAQLRDAGGQLHWTALASVDASISASCSYRRAPDTVFWDGFDLLDALFCDDFDVFATAPKRRPDSTTAAPRSGKDQP